MSRTLPLALLLASASVASTSAQTRAPSAAAARTGAASTWSQTVAPILYKNCAACHHPGGAGPFSLLTYDDARRWSAQILTVTQSRYMPPWLPEPGYGDFADNRRLSADDLAKIKRWVNADMPAGVVAEAPPAPKYTSEWRLGPPDLVLTAPESFTVPADGQDLFRNFIYPVNVIHSRYVRAVEILPGNARVVHHANILIDRTAELRRRHPADWRAGIPGMELAIGSGDRFDPDSHFLFWKPDTPAVVEPPGMPWRIDPGNDLILNTHLKPTGRVETIQPRIGLYFTDDSPTRQPMLLQLEHDAALDIPAGDRHFVVEDQLRLPIAVYALGIYPHAHYLGKQLEAWSTAPDGERTPLILIKDWDIDRQSVYSYREPLLLPAGSVLHMRYVYDNSSANPRNPASPPVRVRNGNRSTDEMGHLWLQVLPVHATERDPERNHDGHESAAAEQNVDSRMILERAWMEHRLARDPKDALAAYNLASLDTMTGDAAGAIAIYRKLAAAQPPNSPDAARTATALGVALEQAAGRNPEQSSSNWQAALASYRRALASDPKDADARYDLAHLELGMEEYDNAAADYRLLLAAHPEDAAAWQQLAFAEQQSRHPAEAEAALRSAIAADPANPESHALLAQLLAARGDLQDAIAEQQTALRLHDHDADGWSNLGVLQAQSGQIERARADFEHALAIDPQHAQAKANLQRLDDSAGKQ